MRCSLLWKGAAVLSALGLVAYPAPAQEVAAHAVHASSPNPELPAPEGFGISGEISNGDWLFRLGYVRYAEDTVKPGVVCRVYSPRVDCITEEVATTAKMGGLRMGVLRAVRFGEILRVGAGGGLSFNSVSASARGSSGRPADLDTPNAGQIGYLGMVSVDLTPVSSIPLRLVGTATTHWVDFEGCADPTDATSGYAPFCGVDRFGELTVGLSYALPSAFGS